MIEVNIETKKKPIQKKIQDWKELEQLLLLYKDYTSVRATDLERLKENEKRNGR